MTEAAVKLAEAYGIIKSVSCFMHGTDDDDLACLLEDAVELLDEVRGDFE